MASQTLSQTHQSLSAALPGTWKLVAGRAITLQPRESGVLRVAHGQMWATYDGPHAGPLNDLGDVVVGVGEELLLRAGQRLVVEPWNAKSPAYFSWDPLPARVRQDSPRWVQVLQPLADLRMAVLLGAGAAGRLIAGLAGLAWELTVGRSREAIDGCRLDGKARTCGAHGAMG